MRKRFLIDGQMERITERRRLEELSHSVSARRDDASAGLQVD